jgi:hypothetical protein
MKGLNAPNNGPLESFSNISKNANVTTAQDSLCYRRSLERKYALKKALILDMTAHSVSQAVSRQENGTKR